MIRPNQPVDCWRRTPDPLRVVWLFDLDPETDRPRLDPLSILVGPDGAPAFTALTAEPRLP